MIIFEEPELDTPSLQPCVSCKKHKVIHPGDYCNSCALKWEPVFGDSYFLVIPSSVADIMEATGIDGAYLNAKQERAFEKHCKYVVYFHKGEWREIVISDGFHLPTIMKRIFERDNDQKA